MRTLPSRSRRRSRLRLAVAALAAAAAVGGLVPAAQAGQSPQRVRTAEPPAPDAKLQQLLQELVDSPGGPPGAIAVLDRGQGQRQIVDAGSGNLATGRDPQATDHMRIASVAKAFSSAVALRLVDERRIRLDSTIGEVLPAQPAAWHAVTLRQLLNHTSGLPDFSQDRAFLAYLTADIRHQFDSRRLIGFVADQQLLFDPGSRYQYSNSDNIAVALMAEAVTGRSYEDLLKELVYHPLGLKRTSLPSGWALAEPYLRGYAVEPPDPPEDVSELISASGVWASGGIVSTPRDLNLFIRGYAGGKLVSKKTHRQQLTFVPGGASEPAGPGANDAGLGIFRYTTRCGPVYGHTGNFPGYTQFAAATRDGSRSLTFSVNSQLTLDPKLLAKARAVQEEFVCALLRP
ncbi:serine hydrolase domain-containing protein [Streptomyces purpureus]|uniref:Beta-lactamase-related domain-containing protein n=1 Tax=Streptomyces purpureus TaxID=1951 RepID=A0A918LM19_9ACTN|nr:serine hydrolase domain-containing protein [Streptomyces purpureus]GGT15031.1 hypothetical protein GCM10014713_04730 [Streptomyces purpureus]